MTLAQEAAGAGRDALAKIDQALSERPHKDDYVLSDASQALCTLRDGLVGQGVTDEASRDRLEAVNAVLGVVLGVHFPIGPVPWEDLEMARGWLAGLLEG